jgi:NAD(P)H-dependent FMN reductase
MKILAFAASNSLNSINKKLVEYAIQFIPADDRKVLDLNDYPAPIFGIDIEEKMGIPPAIRDLANQIDHADLLIISLAEHNGSYTAVFKNIFDWLSRNKAKCFEDKKMLLLSTSTGARGGRSVMDAALTRFPIHGAKIVGHFCLPKFNENFNEKDGIVDETLHNEFQALINQVINCL